MNGYLNQSKFAELLGITRQAVYEAIKDGRVKRVERGIDPTHPDNVHFANCVVERQKAKDMAAKRKKKPKTVTKRTPKPKKPTPKRSQLPYRPVQTEPPPQVKQHFEASESVEMPEVSTEEFYLAPPTNKTEADFHKAIAATKKINMEIAAKMREMVHRDEVQHAFGTMSAAIMDFFLPLGERLAPSVAGLAGSSDPEQIKEVQHAIEEEVTRGLNEVKRIAGEAVESK